MIQTLALFHAAYRELNARKLFWITMLISGLLVGAFAAVGLNETGMTVLWWDFELPLLNSSVMPPDMFYKLLFALFGVPYWLAWLATILALISTAPIMPDMVSGGSIDILLSKPIGRTRLFLTRYFTGLLFVAVQVSVFTVASFFLIGFRGGVWEPWILIAIPLVLIFFSYLFSVCALVGLLTRSTIAALLVTILFWLFIFGVNAAESITLAGKTATELSLEISQEDYDLAVEAGDPIEVTGELQLKLDDDNDSFQTWASVHKWFYLSKTILPKTDETIALLERLLRQNADLEIPQDNNDQQMQAFGTVNRISQRKFQERLQEITDSRSMTWVIGTSLLFEVGILGIACLWFGRRDF